MDSVVALSKAPYAAETAEKTANCKNYIGNLIDFELHQTRRKYVAYHITQNLSKSNSESQQIKRDLLENLDTWIWGVDLKQLYSIFEALPGKVLRPLNRALENVNCLDSRRQDKLSSQHSGQEVAMVSGPTSDPLSNPVAIWEDEKVVGFVTASYDGVTNQRKHVGMNMRHAELLGAERKDAVRCLEWYMKALELPEMDLLACVIHQLGLGARTHDEVYVRGTVGRGVGRCGALLHCVKAKQYDSFGRITRVRTRY